MENIANTATKNNWKTCKQEGVTCPQCGNANRCTIAHDHRAGKCWRNGGEVWHAGGKAKTNGQAPATGEKKSYASAILAIEAMENWTQGRRVADWTYRDSSGNEVAKVVRLATADDKAYRPIHRHKSGWRIGDPPGKWPLYGLNELSVAGVVYVVEGEKCADLAAGLGLAAVTSAHGSSSASKTDWEPLAGRDVVVMPDADEAGEKYAAAVSKILLSLDPPAKVKIVNLSGLPAGGDIEQFLEAGGTREQIEALAEEAEPVNPAEHVGGPVLVCLADVKPKEVQWLWTNRIPLGRLSLVAGRPGEGKSFLTMDMAARVSNGQNWPDAIGNILPSPCPAGSTIIISAEDNADDTIVPRLMACGANLHKIHCLAMLNKIDPETGKLREYPFTLADLTALEQSLRRLPDCRLVVIDPAGSFIGGKVDAHRDNEVRAVLAPLGRLAEKYGVAVLLVAHIRKAAGNYADDLVMGSRAFTGIVRVVWHLTCDTENKDRRLFLPGKNNLARKGDGLAFTITGDPAAIEWEPDPVAMSADDALGEADRGGRPADERSEAADWLGDELADLQEHPVPTVRENAKAAGLVWRTVQRAAKQIGVIVHRATFGGGYVWRLPKPGCDGPPCVPPHACQNPKEKGFGTHGTQAKNGEIYTILTPFEGRFSLACQNLFSWHARRPDGMNGTQGGAQ